MIIRFDGYDILNEIKWLFAVKFAMLQRSQTLKQILIWIGSVKLVATLLMQMATSFH